LNAGVLVRYREWAATVEWVGSEGAVQKVRKEDWKAEGRLNKAARPHLAAAERAAVKQQSPEKTTTNFMGVARPVMEAVGRPAIEKINRPPVDATRRPSVEAEAAGRLPVEAAGRPTVEGTGRLHVEAAGRLPTEAAGRPSFGAVGRLPVEAAGRLPTEAAGRPSVEAVGRPSIESVKRPTKEKRLGSVENIVNLLTRKNRQNVTYQLRLGKCIFAD
jgi:hypothetical protein